ncbi:helix-turn-helix domain-containing protein [Shewanella frigidimarina]|uniref:helix-turn-helix domain-containing protein n=1 Tax=Shewanella frigidimarina TaxID=56812 RepID=UPI003F9F5F6D
MTGYVKYKNDKKFDQLNRSVDCDGGKVLIERLMHLFEVQSRIELGDLIGVTAGTLSTWTTRETTPYELLIRIHLLTGWPMEYLCFGTGDLTQLKKPVTNTDFSETLADSTLPYERGVLQIFTIKNGHLDQYEKIEATINMLQHCNVRGNDNDLVVKDGENLLFIDSNETQVNQGKYLFKVNENHQVGELRLLPDGKVYLLEDNERFPIDTQVTKIVGKVVSVLKKA